MTRTLFFFGSHPKLSLAELEAICGILVPHDTYTIQNHPTCAVVESSEPLDAQQFMQRLGGTVKIAEVIAVTEETLDDWLLSTLSPEKKNIFGISIYSEQSIQDRLQSVRRVGMSLKRSLQASERSVRFVQSQEPTLSAVIVTKEHLIEHGVDLCIVRIGTTTLFARTRAVQPFEEFSERDYGRPDRDSKSGMLPPKLARMMVNFASVRTTSSLLDPFCGSGTVLQEALLMGLTRVYGSDVSNKAVADTIHNLEWLKLAPTAVSVSDARDLHRCMPIASGAPFDAIVFEGYLGTPKPYERDIPQLQEELDALYTETFAILAHLLSPTGTIVAALPFWLLPEFDERLDIDNIVQRNGLTLARPPLYYFRPHARVGREIIIAKKISA